MTRQSSSPTASTRFDGRRWILSSTLSPSKSSSCSTPAPTGQRPLRYSTRPARALGASLALDNGARWIAFTDADTIVPANWLSAQLDLYADASCGQVSIEDWSGYPSAVRERYLTDYSADPRHIHGANLGVSAAAYQRIGGFAALKLGEDVALVSSLLESKADVRFAGPPRVATSARWESTIEGGFASVLRGLREQCNAEAAAQPLAA